VNISRVSAIKQVTSAIKQAPEKDVGLARWQTQTAGQVKGSLTGQQRKQASQQAYQAVITS
jgi:hypothetical protein